jgi:sterol 14-demethylase
MEEGYAKLGDAFTVPVAHKRVTFLIGPDVAPHFFKATDEELSQTEVRPGTHSSWPDSNLPLMTAVLYSTHRASSPLLTTPGDLRMQVYNFNVPTFGKGVVYDVDQKTRTEQFRFFTEALKKDRLAKYVPQFVAEAEVRCAASCGLQGL